MFERESITVQTAAPRDQPANRGRFSGLAPFDGPGGFHKLAPKNFLPMQTLSRGPRIKIPEADLTQVIPTSQLGLNKQELAKTAQATPHGPASSVDNQTLRLAGARASLRVAGVGDINLGPEEATKDIALNDSGSGVTVKPDAMSRAKLAAAQQSPKPTGRRQLAPMNARMAVNPPAIPAHLMGAQPSFGAAARRLRVSFPAPCYG